MSKIITYFFVLVVIVFSLGLISARQKPVDYYLDPKDEIKTKEPPEEIIALLTQRQWVEIECEVTMYTLDECGKKPTHPEYGITAHSHQVLEGRTVAASPEIPVGTMIKIPGLKNIFQVEDRGSAIQTEKGRWPGLVKIDIYTKNKRWALDWGRRKVTCDLLFPDLV